LVFARVSGGVTVLPSAVRDQIMAPRPLFPFAALFLARAFPAAAPSPSPWAPNFAHLGALAMDTLESTPFTLHGKLYVQQARMGSFAPDGAPHSFFCIHDASTGAEVSCPPLSSGYAFQSSIVDDARGTLWVFGSAWDRAQSSAPGCRPWGCGACARGACNVSAMWTSDLVTWGGPVAAVRLPPNVTVPNVAVGFRPTTTPPPPPGVPPHQAFMFLESAVSVAVNVGTDGDLSTNWVLLNASEFATGPAGEAGSCPAARFNPRDRFYYIMGGGNFVDVARSQTLRRGSWEVTPRGPVEAGCVRGFEDCAAPAIARIAPGLYTEYWANGSDRGRRAFLANLSEWNWSANDVDFCDAGGVGPTTFIYGFCAQTRPANATGSFGDGYMVGSSPLSAVEWLASFFPAAP
jgi:hypothetical protein